MVQRYGERFIRVASCLGNSASEVIKAARINPGIMFFESRNTRLHQIGRKKLGKRGGDSDWPRLSACEVHVRIHCETNSGLQMPIFHQLGARQPTRFTESQPCFDAAFVKEGRLSSHRNFPREGGLETAP